MTGDAALAGWVEEPAPAKVNLYLHVTGRRADGYHELDSLVAFADVGDRLVAAPDARISLTIDGPFAGGLGDTDDNLVMRAARLLGEKASSRKGAALRLTKNLPVASGIGGGSADAAAALRALNRLWDLGMPPDALAELALPLGADVPMCVHSRPAYAGGIGETLSFIEAPPLHAVLVNPGVAVSTPDVFRAREGAFSAAPARLAALPSADAFAQFLAGTRNDLEAPARRIAPAIGRTLDQLNALDEVMLARMSGSGATCFALFPTRDAAERAAALVRRREPAWWAVAATLGSPAAG